MTYLLYIFTALFLVLSTSQSSVAIEKLTIDENRELKEIASLQDTVAQQKRFEAFIQNKDPLVSFVVYPLLSIVCLENQDFEKAQTYATELLELAELYVDSWNYGNAIHDGNMVLGIIELHKGHIQQAKAYLAKSALAPNSPQLVVYGPNMMLAEALLQFGEDEAVISYLKALKAVWVRDEGKIDSWIASINGGVVPHFGLNLPFKYGNIRSK